MQLVPITTNVSLTPVHDEVYSVQHDVVKFVSDLLQVGGFRRIPVSSTNKTDRHDKTDILLKVALNTIAPITSLLSLQHERIIKAKAGWLRVSIICLSVDSFFFVSVISNIKI